MDKTDKEKKAWAEIIERAWKDEKFKQRLFTNTEEVLKEYNLPVPKDAHYKLIEETPNEVMIFFPHKPEHVSDEELKNIAAAASQTFPGAASFGAITFSINRGLQ